MDDKAPDVIKNLVERFEKNLSSYKNQGYNEAQLRQEFINPFFEALGWDVYNKGGAAPAYKDVIHEDSIKIASGTKAPDYCFTLSGRRMFFVETKKPAVGIVSDSNPAYQLRRYAWSAKLPLSILTNFEDLCIYESRQKPHVGDKSNVERVKHIKFTEYIEKWDEIASIFSYDAVKQGSFDRFAQSMEKKRGTQEVGEEFLKEIEDWRENLAKSIALRNPDLGVRELNFCVQKTIDRIIFLRMCEDRGIESYGQLQSIAEKNHIYENLCKIFEKADGKYNSGLFHFRKEKQRNTLPDELTLSLSIDDAILKNIFRHLYYPNCPYEFSVLPPEILGNVYEQFLGKVIRLTEGHRAKVEEKPEVKKAGGVFYTPQYIVDYIVRNTVEKLCEGKTPKQISNLRILDPACGSGSFLLGAYSYLLRYHFDFYTGQKNIKRFKEEIYQSKDGQWFLTIKEKKRILLNNIYGVDIDNQAVEVTKLSLLLKVLEGASKDIFEQQQKLWIERALPDLDNNIKCGNSLIGSDFYDSEQTTLYYDTEERYKINAFDWHTEFKEIMNSGGFDNVIGNPPYGATLSEPELKYLRILFKDKSRSYDTYELFLLQASRLLKSEGRLSMIIPASWLTGEKYRMSRYTLLNSLAPIVAYAMPFDVFKDAYIDTAVVVFTDSSDIKTCLIHYFPKKEKLSKIPDSIGTLVQIKDIRSDTLNRLSVVLSRESAPILNKLKTAPLTFGEWFDIQRGVQPYSRKKHSEEQITQRFLHAKSQRSKEFLPELQGNELSRYWIKPERVSYLHYCDEIASTRAMKMFQGERIVLRRLLTRKFRLQASMTAETMITTDNVLNIVPHNPQANVAFALGILNSKLMSWLYINTSMIAQKDDFPQVHISALAALSLPNHNTINLNNMIKFVERMLDLYKQLAAAKTPDDKTQLQRQIDSTDQQIDKLVYELYGLTKKEIVIVEESLKE